MTYVQSKWFIYELRMTFFWNSGMVKLQEVRCAGAREEGGNVIQGTR